MKRLEKFAIALLVIAVLNTIVGIGINSVRPVITNKVALTQLEDTDESYISWNIYNKAWAIWEWSWVVFVAGSVFGVFVINNKEKKEKKGN